jgi:hypothetical protein
VINRPSEMTECSQGDRYEMQFGGA